MSDKTQNYILVGTYIWEYDEITEWVKNMCIHEEFVKSFTKSYNNYTYTICNSISSDKDTIYKTSIKVYENTNLC
jgi:hypothetical protein